MATALASLLDPITPDDFRQRYYGNEPLLVRGHAGKFAGLFTWEDLNRLLNGLTYPHDQIHVSLPGQPNRPNTSRSLIEQCRDGATLGINDVHLLDPKINQFVRALESDTGEPINVNLYLSPPGRAGYPRHYDRHDAFIVQLEGRKSWSVYPRTLERPILQMAEQSYDAPSDPILECELDAGDVLYVPRGHWHDVVAQREMSLHLTVGFNARTGIDFLTWLVNELREDVRCRHELPLSFADDAPEVQQERLRKHIATLEAVLVSRLRDDETARAYSRHCVLNEGVVRRFHLPVQILKAPSSELAVGRYRRPFRQRFLLENGSGHDGITLSMRNHVFQFPGGAKPLVEFILRETEFTHDDAMSRAGELSGQEVREVLDALLLAGIVVPAM